MEYDSRVNERLMQMTEEKTHIIMKKQINALRYTKTDDDNVSATGQQHTEQPEFNNEKGTSFNPTEKRDSGLVAKKKISQRKKTGLQGNFGRHDRQEKCAPFLNVQLTFEQRSSSLVLHQMTSDHNRSELGIQDHNNEPSSSKLIPKVVPLAVKTTTSTDKSLELRIQHHIANCCGGQQVELTMEQIHKQGVSNDILVSIEGVEE
ncbi:hypothetical protein Tco_0822681 [Tanacetum coccineum]|uniref:Uncharacterized protein n=1 Tax=Tanacetum coccineum TaxID=301880 RepID=A0ABQ5AJ24_9ASTR